MTLGRRNPTIADVAQLASVSTGTVSNVLSNHTPVRLETRRRVQAAIAQLNYRPNRIARSLTRQRTHVVGMVVPDVANPFFSELLLGIEGELEAADYVVVFGNARNSGSGQRRYLNSFRERQVDGLILAVTPDSDVAEIEQLAAELPVVLVDRTLPGWKGDQVIGDDQAGMRLAVDHLAHLGHRRLALINGEAQLSTAQRRAHGFEESIRASGLPAGAISYGSFSMESGLAQAGTLFDRVDPPTAICAANDLLALAAVAAANDRGLAIPGELSVVGYDDIAYARLVSPGLTTVRQSAGRIGALAAGLLLERLIAGRTDARSETVKSELVVRGSTGPARN